MAKRLRLRNGRFATAEQWLDDHVPSLSGSVFEEITLEEETVLVSGDGASAVVDGVATAIVGTSVGPVIGIAVGAALAAGSIALLLSQHASSGGGGGNSRGGSGATTSSFIGKAKRIVYGNDKEKGGQDRADDIPNLNIRNGQLRVAKAPANLDSYFNRNPFMNSVVDWDGFYMRSWGYSQAVSSAMTAVKFPLKFASMYGKGGHIFIPELLAVKYISSLATDITLSSTNVMYAFTPTRITESTGVLSTGLTGATHFIAVDPEFQSAIGLYGCTMSTRSQGEEPIVDLRNTRGDGIFWPPCLSITPYTTAGTLPTMLFLYRYREVTWLVLQQIIWRFILQEKYLNQTSAGIVFRGRQALLNFLAIFAYGSSIGIF